MSQSQEVLAKEVSPQQVPPQQVDAAAAKRISKARVWYVTLIVLSVLVFLANAALCGYYAYLAATRPRSSYSSYYGSYYYYGSTFYTWRAGVCGGVALVSLCVLIFYIVRYRRTMRKLRDPSQFMTQGVTYVYANNGAPAFYPPPGTQWQQPQQGYAGAPYPQPAYGPPPPGQQPNPNFNYYPQQYPQPMQQQQPPQQPPVNPSQL
ncbi:hypothetical protein IW146_004240 [Coemansia sp. RSA 922]|nr:hypothetical protein LPJ71_003468 [Coemansia sp. S17]KAJ2015982.1 hypothetical protein GGI14_003927 [Coemansia sp. S680]KAJ2044822.1 hypothetical protein H4S04_005999 [Coemansia sp. S16]KAJ2084513.1 hypothetical protein GGI09_007233 [Coemansia sp. S100]KAJ2112947.1 hypothetical protein IW146_004240 [Coemansia sp. RSA 922]